jgi:hypothetical protein
MLESRLGRSLLRAQQHMFMEFSATLIALSRSEFVSRLVDRAIRIGLRCRPGICPRKLPHGLGPSVVRRLGLGASASVGLRWPGGGRGVGGPSVRGGASETRGLAACSCTCSSPSAVELHSTSLDRLVTWSSPQVAIWRAMASTGTPAGRYGRVHSGQGTPHLPARTSASLGDV